MPASPLSQNQEKNSESLQLQGRVNQLESLLYALQEELQKSKETVSTLQSQLIKLYEKSFTTCVQCNTEYDLLTHHYSIGLYDNLVFVKCPKCQKDMAIDRIDGLKRE
ncbi:MAG: hypothetical protein ACYDBV_04910 [Nitrospiria bacterium]